MLLVCCPILIKRRLTYPRAIDFGLLGEEKIRSPQTAKRRMEWGIEWQFASSHSFLDLRGLVMANQNEQPTQYKIYHDV